MDAFALANLINCPLCQQLNADPITLSCCGQTACRSCLDRGTTCPFCRKEYKVGGRTSVVLADLVRELQNSNMIPAREGGYPCDNCNDFEAEKCCGICFLKLCPIHLEQHGKNPLTKDHTLFTYPENAEFLYKRMVCTPHKLKKVMFCETHLAGLCSKCMLEDHRSCEVVSIPENNIIYTSREVLKMEEEYERGTKEIVSMLDSEIERREKTLEASLRSLSRIEEMVIVHKESLKNYYQEDITHLKKKGKKLLEERKNSLGAVGLLEPRGESSPQGPPRKRKIIHPLLNFPCNKKGKAEGDDLNSRERFKKIERTSKSLIEHLIMGVSHEWEKTFFVNPLDSPLFNFEENTFDGMSTFLNAKGERTPWYDLKINPEVLKEHLYFECEIEQTGKSQNIFGLKGLMECLNGKQEKCIKINFLLSMKNIRLTYLPGDNPRTVWGFFCDPKTKIVKLTLLGEERHTLIFRCPDMVDFELIVLCKHIIVRDVPF